MRVAFMMVVKSLHRVFAHESPREPDGASIKESATDAAKTFDNVVDIAGARIGGTVGTTNDNDTAARPSGRSGRVRTRFLPAGEENKSHSPPEGSIRSRGRQVHGPAGWLVVIEGPGVRDRFALESGLTYLGRGADQEVCLDFGDQAISRQSHAFIAYDIALHRFQLSHGESQNRTRLNGVLVDEKTALTHGDCISIGKTTLRIAAFCDDRFRWPPIVDKGGPK